MTAYLTFTPGRRTSPDGVLDISFTVGELSSIFGVQITSSDPRYSMSFVRSSDNLPHTQPTFGSFIIMDINEDVVNSHVIRIERPTLLLGNTGPFMITVSVIGSPELTDTTTIVLNDPIIEEDTLGQTDLQRGSTSAMGLLLLALASILYTAFRMAKLYKGVFIISLGIALVGIGLLASDDGPL